MGDEMKKSPLVRKTDPQTSRDAAKKARKFANDHITAICYVLHFVGIDLTPTEILRYIDLDYYQIQRRGAEMERKGIITRGPEKRKGQRVWRLAK